MNEGPASPKRSESDPALEETLEGLEMPPSGLLRWFEHNRAFCDAHGGRRVYGELLELFDECESAVRRRWPDP